MSGFISLGIMFSTFVHVAACIRILITFQAEYYSIVCIYHILFIHSSVDGHLGCFHLLAIVTNATMNIRVQVSVWFPSFDSFWYIPRSRISGSYSNSIFNFLRKLHTVLHSGHPIYILTSNAQLQFLRILANSCYFQVFFKIIIILMGVKWYPLCSWFAFP